MPLTRKIKPPLNNQSHSTNQRVRDENVNVPHTVNMVMVMCLFSFFFNVAGIDRKLQIISHYSCRFMLFISGCLVVVGEHLCGRGKKM